MKTLPQLALEWGQSLDRLRLFLRTVRPDLAELSLSAGRSRVRFFDEDAAEKIRAAYGEWLASKTTPAA